MLCWFYWVLSTESNRHLSGKHVCLVFQCCDCEDSTSWYLWLSTSGVKCQLLIKFQLASKLFTMHLNHCTQCPWSKAQFCMLHFRRKLATSKEQVLLSSTCSQKSVAIIFFALHYPSSIYFSTNFFFLKLQLRGSAKASPDIGHIFVTESQLIKQIVSTLSLFLQQQLWSTSAVFESIFLFLQLWFTAKC